MTDTSHVGDDRQRERCETCGRVTPHQVRIELVGTTAGPVVAENQKFAKEPRRVATCTVCEREKTGTGRQVSAADVLDSFTVYQPKTAGMVAEEFGIERQRAIAVLARLETTKALTRARGGTETPVWLRRRPPTT